MNDLDLPSAAAPSERSQLGTAVRRLLVTTAAAAALAAAGMVVPAAASAAEPARVPAVSMHTATLLPAFCPFGRHKGKRGCRGGSVGQAISDNGYGIATGVGCGLVGVGAGAVTVNPAVGFGAGVGCGLLVDAAPAG